MKNGIRVRHKLTGEEMTIKRIYKTIATCKIDNPHYNNKQMFLVDVQICAIENLEII